MDIFWIKNKQRCGPLPVPEIISKIQVGELNPEDLGWHAGCKNWVPLKELPALADFLQEKKDSAEEAQELTPDTPQPFILTEESPKKTSADPIEKGDLYDKMRKAFPQVPSEVIDSIYSVMQIKEANIFARALARIIDCCIYLTLYFGVLFISNQPYSDSLLFGNPLIWVPMIFIEAVLIASFGLTPGKLLCGIQVRSISRGGRLSFGESLRRAFFVFVLGVGLMMPPFLIILAPVITLFMLKKRGITSWDLRSGCIPLQVKPFGVGRVLLAIFTLFMCMQVMGYCLMPWIPALVERMEEVQPGSTEQLRQMLPPEAIPAPKPPEKSTSSETLLNQNF